MSWRLRQTLATTFASLRHRNFRLFFIGQTISNSGNWLTNVALTLFVLSLTNSGVALGLLAACQYGPILLLSAWAGAIADRADKRRLLFVTQSLEMTQSIGLAILAFSPHPPRAGLYALALGGGVLLAFDNPLRRSFVTEMVPRADIPNAVVLYSLIVNVSRIFGPTLAGLLVVSVGYGWCFAVDAVSYLAVLACLFLMRPAELHRAQRQAPIKGAVREGLRYVRSQPALWIPFVMYAVIGLLAYNFTVTLPLFVTEALRGSDADFTAIYAIFSVGAVVGALVVARRVGIALRQIIRGAALLGLSLLLLAAVPSVRLAFPVALLVGVASILYTTATTASVQVVARPEMQGCVLSLQFVLMGGGSAIGGPLLGWLADAAGARAIVILGGVVCFAAAAFGAIASRDAAPAVDRAAAPAAERDLVPQPKR
ncbi:MAG TPA: MFS transporter [Thermomicrobiales bacterium]|nr:MFS transporter [Thermomicrobiales bacterium]